MRRPRPSPAGAALPGDPGDAAGGFRGIPRTRPRRDWVREMGGHLSWRAAARMGCACCATNADSFVAVHSCCCLTYADVSETCRLLRSGARPSLCVLCKPSCRYGHRHRCLTLQGRGWEELPIRIQGAWHGGGPRLSRPSVGHARGGGRDGGAAWGGRASCLQVRGIITPCSFLKSFHVLHDRYYGSNGYLGR